MARLAVRVCSLSKDATLPTDYLPIRQLLVLALCASACSGCRSGKPAPPAPPPPVVAVVRPIVQKVQNYYEYNGYLEAIESVQVQARVEGMLTDILFQEGDEVEKNKPLYKIDNREYLAGVAKSEAEVAKAEADIANAEVQIRNAKSDFERVTSLGNAASKAELEKSAGTLALTQAQLKVAVASKGAAQAALSTSKLKLEYTDIRAEIAGRISRTRVTRGNLVGQKEPTLLTTILSVDPLHVYFDVPERDFVEYQKAVAENTVMRPAKGDLRVDIGVVNEEGYPHTGFMDFRDNRVETGTGTVRLRGRVDNPMLGSQKSRLLYPGLYSRVQVPRGKEQEMLLIPEDALMTGQEGRYVYVVETDNTVTKRTVKVGPQFWRMPTSNAPQGETPKPGWKLAAKAPPTADKPAIAAPLLRSVVAIPMHPEKGKGLQPGDSVIVVGLQKVRLGATAQPEEWELKGPTSPVAR